MIGENNFKRPKLILLDVYETLLDMSVVEKKLNNLLDSKRAYRVWFELLMQYCFVENCTSKFNDFTSIAKATMQMTAKVFGASLHDEEINYILALLKQLPVHEDVQEGLSQLNDLEFRIAALTNSPSDTVMDRMERTGLISYFSMVLSAEEVRKYKPCIEVYQWAANKLEVDKQEILMVSAHAWDIAGAVNAGLQTAYVRQKEEMYYPLAPKPDLVCNNLSDLAGQLRNLFPLISDV